jgi:hypothetical protein
MHTYQEAILRAKPDAKVISQRRDMGPLKVTVKTEEGKELWSGDQR